MRCPFRHEQGEKMVVCKHWLRGLCRRSDYCSFLHQYDVSRMPVCYFHSKFGNCSNKECPFLHLKPVPTLQKCPWYDQGFCKEGPLCKYRHVHQVLCPNYYTGFCPQGPKCQFGHPKMSPVFYPSNVKPVNQLWDSTTSTGDTLVPPSQAKPMVHHQKKWNLPQDCSSRVQLAL
ncbi:putative cleavage and polyadenylation specificity factor subunit 4-like protein [Arvicanthis niloticus]|uniref:putative cleavage and polyadenylation specificity factor subunit 4-like protein n=1 Tax=Arvicanthis niloticus TaxID=61156 RepID=UPI00402B248C